MNQNTPTNGAIPPERKGEMKDLVLEMKDFSQVDKKRISFSDQKRAFPRRDDSTGIIQVDDEMDDDLRSTSVKTRDEERFKRFMENKYANRDLKRKLVQKLDVENERFKNTLTSCCFRIDRRFVELILKFSVILSVLVFSIIKLYISEDATDKTIFLNLVSLILGTFLQAPSITNKEKDKK